MTKKIYLLFKNQTYYFLFMLILSCQTPSKSNANIEIANIKTPNVKIVIPFIDTIRPKIPYTQTLLKIKKEIEETKKIIKNQKLDKKNAFKLKKNLFEKALVHQIFPYWYGTKWSFAGHTEIPNQGTVSCGYFVSTTLLHLGVQVDRITLAQQSPINEARTLDIDEKMINIGAGNFECDTIIKNIKEKLEEGVYFVGFGGTHVGFLIQRKTDLYLVHTGSTSIVTVIDKVENIPFFCLFYNYYIVPLSTNENFLDKWLDSITIKTYQK